MRSSSRWWLVGLLAGLVFPAASAPVKDPVAQSLPALQAQLTAIMRETNVPGVSVAIVGPAGPEWVGGLGLANVERQEPVTADTLFRIGSTSKAFTAISLLQLAEQGRLSLEDPVSRYVSNVPYENPWEDTAPLLVADLLEHTGGWDDLSIREFAQQAPGWTLHQGLTFDARSHRSRWRPGTRMSYANAGTAMGAAVLEKVTGQTLEAYVGQHLFGPIGMTTATYMEPAGIPATTLYHADGKTPYPYWHVIVRPAGSINASARDMAAYLGFYLGRGKVGETQLVAPESVTRMETPTRSWAAREGVRFGYGLHNYASAEDGFVFHGHDGGVSGGITRMSYLPAVGKGFFISINSDNGAAFARLSNMIRRYMTRDVTPPAVPAAESLPVFTPEYAGWYRPDSPRNESFRFIERLLGLTYVAVEGNGLVFRGLMGEARHYVASGGRTFRRNDAGDIEPVATMALITPQPEGRFIGFGSFEGTLKQVPLWQVVLEFLGTAWFVVAIAIILLYAPFWLIGRWIRGARPMDRSLRTAGVVAALSLLAFIGSFVVATDDLLANLGHPTPVSVTLCLSTWMFALATLALTYFAFGKSSLMARRWVRLAGRFCAVGLLLGTGYLTYWGVIGLRTWA